MGRKLRTALVIVIGSPFAVMLGIAIGVAS